MENTNMNVEVFDIAEGAVEACENSNTVGGKKNVKLAIGIAAVAVGVVAVARRFKGRFEEMQVKHLQKKGYAVYKPEEVIDDEDYEVVEIEK